MYLIQKLNFIFKTIVIFAIASKNILATTQNNECVKNPKCKSITILKSPNQNLGAINNQLSLYEKAYSEVRNSEIDSNYQSSAALKSALRKIRANEYLTKNLKQKLITAYNNQKNIIPINFQIEENKFLGKQQDYFNRFYQNLSNDDKVLLENSFNFSAEQPKDNSQKAMEIAPMGLTNSDLQLIKSAYNKLKSNRNNSVLNIPTSLSTFQSDDQMNSDLTKATGEDSFNINTINQKDNSIFEIISHRYLKHLELFNESP